MDCVLRNLGSRLGDRSRAVELRKALEESLMQGGSVRLDFGGVEMVTQSFVDELVGVPIRKLGIDKLRSISFRNCSQGIKSVIAVVVDYSARHPVAAQKA